MKKEKKKKKKEAKMKKWVSKREKNEKISKRKKIERKMKNSAWSLVSIAPYSASMSREFRFQNSNCVCTPGSPNSICDNCDSECSK